MLIYIIIMHMFKYSHKPKTISISIFKIIFVACILFNHCSNGFIVGTNHHFHKCYYSDVSHDKVKNKKLYRLFKWDLGSLVDKNRIVYFTYLLTSNPINQISHKAFLHNQISIYMMKNFTAHRWVLDSFSFISTLLENTNIQVHTASVWQACRITTFKVIILYSNFW